MIRGLLSLAFQAYFVILLARVVLSWMSLSNQRGAVVAQVGRVVYSLTEPLLRPVRKALRPYQGRTAVDFSPMVLYFALLVVEQLLLTVLRNAGM